jgi:hypothetical protein
MWHAFVATREQLYAMTRDFNLRWRSSSDEPYVIITSYKCGVDHYGHWSNRLRYGYKRKRKLEIETLLHRRTRYLSSHIAESQHHLYPSSCDDDITQWRSSESFCKKKLIECNEPRQRLASWSSTNPRSRFSSVERLASGNSNASVTSVKRLASVSSAERLASWSSNASVTSVKRLASWSSNASVTSVKRLASWSSTNPRLPSGNSNASVNISNARSNTISRIASVI